MIYQYLTHTRTHARTHAPANSLNLPRLGPDRYGGVGLLPLVKRFKEDVMYIWFGLLTGARVLFSGQPAAAVCDSVLAAPLLAAPLTGFEDCMAPYVCLQDMAPLAARPYICGATNTLFETRPDSFDVLASLTTGQVLHTPDMRVSGSTRSFAKSVVHGVMRKGRGEVWARAQFQQFTEAFLDHVATDSLKGVQKKLFRVRVAAGVGEEGGWEGWGVVKMDFESLCQ